MDVTDNANTNQKIDLNSAEENLLLFAKKLAIDHENKIRLNGSKFDLTNIRNIQKLMLKQYRYYRQTSDDHIISSPATEWILDNFYVIQQAIRQIFEDLPSVFIRELPVMIRGELEKNPRIYAVATSFLSFQDLKFDASQLDLLIENYQTHSVLSIGELWAFPAMLRISIVQWMALHITKISGKFADDLDDPLIPILPNLKISSEDVVSNGIMALRRISTHDWKKFFERNSIVERILRQDPANIYSDMDFETRDGYRDVIERLAKGSGINEAELTEYVLEKAEGYAEKQHEETKRTYSGNYRSHVGYYLVDEGIDTIEKTIQYTPKKKERLPRWMKQNKNLFYFSSISLFVSLFHYLITVILLKEYTLPIILITNLIAFIPISTVVIEILHWLISQTLKPRVLPKMNFSKGIPDEYRTLVVVPCLISSMKTIESLLNQIEVHYLGNQDPNIFFALLSDFFDADHENSEMDDQFLRYAHSGIEALNKKYNSHQFFLLHRKREWNASEKKWMGWERKRGKLIQLNAWLAGRQNLPFDHVVGSINLLLKKVRYVITLDADTVLSLGIASKLIGTLAHPLNQAVIIEEKVSRGYVILQPRVQVKPTAANVNRFSRIFAANTGLDLYSRAISDVYQDLFNEGIYTGKGIYDVAVLDDCLNNRIPENRILSHDLFEGIHSRVGLTSDVVFYEDFPSNVIVYASRNHRWIRGDWQLLPWLGFKVPLSDGTKKRNHLTFLHRWQVVDNLRRSLFPISIFSLLVYSWLILPQDRLIWMIIVIISQSFPFLIEVFSIYRSIRRSRERPKTDWSRLLNTGWRIVYSFVFLAFDFYFHIDAIVRTLYRVFISHRNMLEWNTMDSMVRKTKEAYSPSQVYRDMWQSPVLSFLLLGILIIYKPLSISAAFVFIMIWGFAPLIAFLLGAERVSKPYKASLDEYILVRSLACRTWMFFDKYVTPTDHWLPPDHFQKDPRGTVAHRTSPTNIGLYLLSVFTGFDLGYVNSLNLSLRLRSAMNNLNRLEKYNGHPLNWYDTQKLSPLYPRYVSTVDSGNLYACLVTLREALIELSKYPIFRWEYWQTFVDYLRILEEEVETEARRLTQNGVLAVIKQIKNNLLALHENSSNWESYLENQLSTDITLLNRVLNEFLDAINDPGLIQSIGIWLGQINQHASHLNTEVQMIMPWIRLDISKPISTDLIPEEYEPTIRAIKDFKLDIPIDIRFCDIAEIIKTKEAEITRIVDEFKLIKRKSDLDIEQIREIDAHIHWGQILINELVTSQLRVKAILIGFEGLIDEINQYCEAMQFSFLFDNNREVFHIGYNLETGKKDDNYYDLLASEARIASLIAIAKKDVPKSHWLHLSRPITYLEGKHILLSWSGTMFEYLMPPLIMRSTPGSLLDQSAYGAVDRQIRYGEENGVPWGISESGYFHFDVNQNYQYRAFGVPGLGFKRGLSEDLVISPYASLIAINQRPKKVFENIQLLKKIGVLGLYGFFEAVDFTVTRTTPNQRYHIVKSYMAHHQGMILLALANFLTSDKLPAFFHRAPEIQSVEIFLHELVSEQVPIEHPHEEELDFYRPLKPEVAFEPVEVEQKRFPNAALLSNGRFQTFVTNNGGGYCAWKDRAITRWREDSTLDNYGQQIFVLDKDTKENISPIVGAGEQTNSSFKSYFFPHKVEFHNSNHDIITSLEVTVSGEDDLQCQKLIIKNHSNRSRNLEVYSYAELVMTDRKTDMRHQAFSKLFIESKYDKSLQMAICRRRKRSQYDQTMYIGHKLVSFEKNSHVEVSFSREDFFANKRKISDQRIDYSNIRDYISPLDPIISIGTSVNIPSKSELVLYFLTFSADEEKKIAYLGKKYFDKDTLDRVIKGAEDFSVAAIDASQISMDLLKYAQVLLSLIQYPSPFLRGAQKNVENNFQGQSALWQYGISGDYPIILILVSDPEQLSLMNEVLEIYAYWRIQGLMVDLVFLNMKDTSYDQSVNDLIFRTINRKGLSKWLNQRGGLFMVRNDQSKTGDFELLHTAARVVLDCDKGNLQQYLQSLPRPPSLQPIYLPQISEKAIDFEMPTLERPDNLVFDNGIGGFSPNGNKYIIYLEKGMHTPAPWINVIANNGFGFTVSESGSGFTWAENSGENRITPWKNDPVLDTSGEVIYLRDDESAEIWTPTAKPVRDEFPYLITHGQGYSIFQHNSHGLEQHMTMFTDAIDPVKFVQVQLKNSTDRNRRISIVYYLEWVLGVNREDNQQYILTEFDAKELIILAKNSYNSEFKNRYAFITATRSPDLVTADRREFIGYLGKMERPEGLNRHGFSPKFGAFLDPCGVYKKVLWIAPGETKEITFIIGQGKNKEEAIRLAKKYKDINQIDLSFQRTIEKWSEINSQVQINTPDKGLNILANHWLLYQTLSCRIWGRSGLYQSSGAYGFRDQLQDVMALLVSRPEIVKEHILRSAHYQFEEGDVLHWWHPPSGRGVKTRCSDDLLWLPYVVLRYISVTGDKDILQERVPFLIGDPLSEIEHDRYGYYPSTSETFSIFDHCVRAIDKGMTYGIHKLPLIGSHDWNDGYSMVGVEGKGESVWNAWFIIDILKQFAEICESMGEEIRANIYLDNARKYLAAIEEFAWDGDWFIRAFYDDGQPLGSAANSECKIDSLSQTWAIFSDTEMNERKAKSMQSVYEMLVDHENGIIKLFTPAFDKTHRNPGYIKGYPPGVRENGGQYTHAATWVVWAFAKLGEFEKLDDLVKMMNPIYHSNTNEKANDYRVEPYVIAADIYGQPPYEGRGGWTWYTGSAGWMYRLIMEGIIGFEKRGAFIHLNPKLPASWDKVEVAYRYFDTTYEITIQRNGKKETVRTLSLSLDGKTLEDLHFPLVDDGRIHQIEVII
jgi:cyclic beta-1,2-glucan synthetase